MRLLGIAFVVLGALVLAYQSVTFVTRETVVDAGPVQISADRQRTVWIPPVVGGVAVVTGLVLIAGGGDRKTT